jgi:5-methylcytosine-specific restriction protein A
MPSRAKKTCLKVGCPNLTDNKYCEEHQALNKQPRVINRDKQKEREYNKQRAKTPTRMLYDRKWREYSKDFLKRNPICVVCGNQSQAVDHVIPHKGNKGLFWTRFNHRALCKSCHNRATAMYDGGFGNKIKPKE